MESLPFYIAIALFSIVGMEGLATLSHRYIMHGFGWRWHRSHHSSRQGWWETNDLYAVIMSIAAIGIFYTAGGPDHWLWWVGFGVTLYGLLYTLLHDGIVHRRFPLPIQLRSRRIKKLVQAHHLHHSVHEKHGAVSFGFLYAPSLECLRAKLKANRAEQRQ